MHEQHCLEPQGHLEDYKAQRAAPNTAKAGEVARSARQHCRNTPTSTWKRDRAWERENHLPDRSVADFLAVAKLTSQLQGSGFAKLGCWDSNSTWPLSVRANWSRGYCQSGS